MWSAASVKQKLNEMAAAGLIGRKRDLPAIGVAVDVQSVRRLADVATLAAHDRQAVEPWARRRPGRAGTALADKPGRAPTERGNHPGRLGPLSIHKYLAGALAVFTRPMEGT